VAADMFSFKPAEVPKATRGRRRSKYAATVEAVHEYLAKHADERSVKIELGSVDSRSAAASFRMTVAKNHPDSLRLVQRGEDLYIERR
jgi:hypothetical protein